MSSRFYSSSKRRHTIAETDAMLKEPNAARDKMANNLLASGMYE